MSIKDKGKAEDRRREREVQSTMRSVVDPRPAKVKGKRKSAREKQLERKLTSFERRTKRLVRDVRS